MLCRAIPYEGQEKYIFLSYCHKDAPLVYPILEQLVKDGYRVWYDDGNHPGDDWMTNIANHLAGCHICLAMISENSENSFNCRSEIAMAIKRKKKLLAVILKDFEMSLALEMQLGLFQYVKGYEYSSNQALLQKLYEAEAMKDCQAAPGSLPLRDIPAEKPETKIEPDPVPEKTPEPKIEPDPVPDEVFLVDPIPEKTPEPKIEPDPIPDKTPVSQMDNIPTTVELTPAPSWTCSCGNVSNGNFCSECGAPKPVDDGSWTCTCGTKSTGKFCPNCGSKKPAAEPVKPIEESVKPVEESVKPVDEPVKPVEEPVKSVEEPVKSVEESAKPVDEPVKPVEESAKPVEESDEGATELSSDPDGEVTVYVGRGRNTPADDDDDDDDDDEHTVRADKLQTMVLLRPRESTGYILNYTPVTLGRAKKCDIRLLNNDYISSSHIRIVQHKGCCYLQDLGSTNGTFVGDKKLAANEQLQLESPTVFKLYDEPFIFLYGVQAAKMAAAKTLCILQNTQTQDFKFLTEGTLELVRDALGGDKLIGRKNHAALRQDDGKFFLVDKGHPNGVLLNNRMLDEHETCQLTSGDQIRIGNTTLEVCIAELQGD